MDIHRIVKPISRRFRRKRMSEFERIFRLSSQHNIVDVGGYADNWSLVSAEPTVLLVNIDSEEHKAGRFRKVRGDGCALQFADREFDVAYSNSVIEHVGAWDRQKAFASEIRRVGKSYYIQTPNRHFPIEPHVLMPFAQYFPKPFAKWFLKRFSPHAIIQKPSQESIDNFVETTRLLTYREMRELFPDATIEREKLLGLTKSFIAYRVTQ